MISTGVSVCMFLPVPAHPGSLGQSPKSRKTVVCVCAHVLACARAYVSQLEMHSKDEYVTHLA